jgi:sugar O-acyltransferase (sialic acid O-acetyltransferase NeuD family)
MEDTQFTKKKFAIVGAGGLGREIFSWVSQSEEFSSIFECSGFLDDNDSKLLNINHKCGIVGKFQFNKEFKFKYLLIGIANTDLKNKIWNQVESLNSEFIGFIHKTTLLGIDTKFEPSLITFPNVIVSCNVIIGKGVFINNGSQIGHDTIIGDFVSIMANVDIGGNCEISNKVFIGSGATILPGIKIPENTIIGAGSVVFRNIKESGTYVGNPAKKIF